MKKAFTLVELMAVIIILALVGAILVPVVNNVINNNKQNLYEAQIKEIETATEKYALYNLSDLPLTENDILTITLKDIKDAKLIDLNIINPKTEEPFNDNMLINIKYENNKYHFTVLDEGVTESNDKAPKLTLNGDFLIIKEINTEYTELGAEAVDKNNSAVEVDITYKKNDIQINSINMQELGTNTIVYSANFIENSEVYTSYIFRTLIVQDSIKPQIIIPGKLRLTLSQASTYNLKSDVVVTDNSGDTLELTVTNLNPVVGEHIITYTATDNSGNKTEEKRIVEIVE